MKPSTSNLKDRYITGIAVCAGAMLLAILLGGFIPPTAQVLLAGLALQGMLGLIVQLNLIPGRDTKRYRWAFGFSCLVFAAIFFGIVYLDHVYQGGAQLVAGMEPATALMVFGITLWPFTAVSLWVIGFQKVIYSTQAQQTIKSLATEK